VRAFLAVRRLEHPRRPIGNRRGLSVAVARRGFAPEGRTGDQHDAFCIAAWLARADRDGTLAGFLKPDLSPPERAMAQVEGWISAASKAGGCATRRQRHPETSGSTGADPHAHAFLIEIKPHSRDQLSSLLKSPNHFDFPPVVFYSASAWPLYRQMDRIDIDRSRVRPLSLKTPRGADPATAMTSPAGFVVQPEAKGRPEAAFVLFQ
jgi:hypothetical protein